MAVREGLLALLREGPSHGYQLKTAWETSTGGVWSLNVGQVYTPLDRLARYGSVAVREGDGPQQYAIPAAVRADLQARPEERRGRKERVSTSSNPVWQLLSK